MYHDLTQPHSPPPRQPRSVLVTLSIAQFMVTLGVTAGTVALPSISRALLAVSPMRPAPGVKAKAAVH
jgi:hypothetical protein